MTTDAAVAMNSIPQATTERKPRTWLPITLVVIYWAYVVITNSMEMPMFPRFMSQTGVLIVVGLVFLIWWLFNRRVKLVDRFIVLGAAIASLVVAKVLSDKTLGPFPIMSGLPLVFTGWALWMLLARKARACDARSPFFVTSRTAARPGSRDAWTVVLLAASLNVTSRRTEDSDVSTYSVPVSSTVGQIRMPGSSTTVR